ncbi:MAG TPA: DUF6496 domain-containing protein [Candidatus Saccharimonadia bacterium]|nr:DUF6496 domain-containing protein [Candidatus Saccharimonadia bacterium]
MAKYGPKAQEKVEKTLHEYKHEGQASGFKSRKQAIAVGLGMARKAGAKAPPAPKPKKSKK